jgi:NADH pyrophosphatase NudC (nudix superfamily)
VDRVNEKRSMSGWISLVASFLTRRPRPPPKPHWINKDRSAELRDFEAAQQRKVIIHPSVTLPRVRAAMEKSSSSADDVRFCTVCGVQHTGDASAIWHLHCHSCGAYAVYRADELLFSLAGDLKGVDEAR